VCNIFVTICYENVTLYVYVLEYGLFRNRKVGYAGSINECYNRHFPKKCNSNKNVTHKQENTWRKEKTIKKQEKSTPQRIPNHILDELKKIGNGNWKDGLSCSVNAWKIMNENPEIKVMKDVDVLMSDIRLYYSDNHYDHFNNFPAVMHMFLKRGVPDFSIMKSKRFEKSLKEFDKDAEDD